MNLTDEQQRIISHDTSSFRVIAGAGSGKTTTMALFVERAITSGRYRESEICFITFTRLAASEIRAKIRKHVGRSTQIRCGTFHKTMFTILQESEIPLPDHIYLYDGCMERMVEFFLGHMRAATPALIETLKIHRLLIVDEFQDLDPHQFEFIRLFRAAQPNLQIVAIGDLAQNIYRFRGTSNEFLRRLLQVEVAPELVSYRLTTNFRSNPLILTCVNMVFAEEIESGHVLPMVAGRTDIPPVIPSYYEYARNPGSGMGEYELLVVDTLVPIILDARSAGKSVALIFPVIKCFSYEIIMAGFQDRLRGRMDFHRIAKEDANCSVVEVGYDPRAPDAPVQCASFHASKGLEWDIVALVNVSDAMYDTREGDCESDDEGFYQERTNLLYVGMTRAIERLLVFANTNHGGRHRLLARHEERLGTVMDITKWGEDTHETHNDRSLSPIGVTRLVPKFAQHPDLFARVRACSERISVEFHSGDPLPHDEIYTQMKVRNREMAFGTFMDWKIKRALSNSPTLQCRVLELFANMSGVNWFHRDVTTRSLEAMYYTLEEFFDRAGNLPSTDLKNYIVAARTLALYNQRKFRMDPAIHCMYSRVERSIMHAYKKEAKGATDDYLLSQAFSLFNRGHLAEIQAVSAPPNSYSGLPAEFDEFAACSVSPAAALVRIGTGVPDDTEIYVDVSVETESLIMGETDLIVGDGIVDIKCSRNTTSAGLRGASCCSNLLQLLSYVAMGRHGTLALPCKWAMLINPLTATWERYDISAWSEEDSREFLECLEELRRREA
jgi:hypothetical protein